MNSFKAILILTNISFSLCGQTKTFAEIKKEERRQILIKSDSVTAKMLGVEGLKSTFQNFLKNDTVYYPNKSLLRTSEASNGSLNGNLVYYCSNGQIYERAKLKDNEYCDTTFYYSNKGALQMMTVYHGFGTRTVREYYNTGEVKRICKVKVVYLTEEERKNSNKQANVITESDKYYNKKGKEISNQEYLKVLKDDLKYR